VHPDHIDIRWASDADGRPYAAGGVMMDQYTIAELILYIFTQGERPDYPHP